ncbi:unnamed protein product [Effrenium voratum]|uniref:Uncharacterized protein n=1 Tax=Effrenium voratum TaxID=2562239 RepID=A0AA36NAB3_9DINO|nr:unnamed protein product [Effrenium voratum]
MARVLLALPVVLAMDFGEMADSYFGSMSSPAVSDKCKKSKTCCPGSQCIPGMELVSGCQEERGVVSCEAAEDMSNWPLKNGICRCAAGYSCETGKCLEDGDSDSLSELPQLKQRNLTEVRLYRKAAAVNWASIILGLLCLLALTHLALRCRRRSEVPVEEDEDYHAELSEKIKGLRAQMEADSEPACDLLNSHADHFAFANSEGVE